MIEIHETPQIRELSQYVGQSVTLKGWVSNKRTGGKVAFIVLRDGSGYTQCVIDLKEVGEEKLEIAKKLTLESSIAITGNVIENDRQEGGFEIQATDIHVYQIAEEYPIAKKEHGVDFLLGKRHLWLRSKKQWAILRVRNRVKYVIHTFFQERGFIQTDAPLLTGNACEGTTTLFETEFYDKGAAYLSQSGQLYGEAMAMAHGRIYTFGPTFRAEKSVTPRHLSEFWMIEPEMAYFDLDMNMNLIEDFIKYVVKDVLETCQQELEILGRDTTIFENIAKFDFPRMTYDEAVLIIRGEQTIDGKTAIQAFEEDLAAAQEELTTVQAEITETEATLAKGGLKKGKMNYFRSKCDKLKARAKKLEEDIRNIPQWIDSAKNFPPGEDLGAAHERALTRLFNVPIMVTKWPANIKAFYMKRYDDAPDYVKGVDVIAPEGFGEIVGGSERENDLQKILDGVEHHELPMEAFEWYADLRRYGSVPHAGFGLGFERTIMWLTGVGHIRETIPFPRYYGRLFP